MAFLLEKKKKKKGPCSCLGNSMDRRAWWATVHGVAKSWAGLSN